MTSSNGVIMTVAEAKRRIAMEAEKLDSDPSPSRADAATTRVVNDVIDTFGKNSRASEKEKLRVLTRLGKFAKSAAYRAALATAIAAREVAFTAALVAAMTIGTTTTAVKSYQLLFDPVWRTGENAKRVFMTYAVIITMSASVAFVSYVKLLKRTLHLVKKVAWNWI